jgi:uncharacterized protein (TIGR03083 family)
VYAAQSTITQRFWRKDGGMDPTPYPNLVRADADALLEAAAGALDTPVPSCPGWTVERLVGHLGRVYRSNAGWVLTPEAPPTPERAPAGAAVLDWTRAGRDQFLEAVAALDDDATVPTWLGPQPGRFWPRRMAVETAIHRWDAEAAVGSPASAAPIDAALAVEGIEELVTVLLPRRGGGGLAGGGEVLHLHATDADGEWLLTLTDGPPTVDHGHAKGDVAARGPASDLLLFLTHRVAADRLQVFGDADLLERWRQAVHL